MLPINLEYAPMEALLVDKVPSAGNWQYEPKWDGFRCLAFREEDALNMRSKSGQPLDRYFPEVVAILLNSSANKFVLDGELVINHGAHFSFDELLERIHPAASRIKMLSQERPATFIVFDILVDQDGNDLTQQPLEERRAKLEQFYEQHLKGLNRVDISPASTDFAVAQEWWKLVGEGLDGLVAKRLGIPYATGTRKGMQKIKKMRTADCIIGGFRYSTGTKIIGSLLLGLYDENGNLNHVGFTSAFKADEKKRLTELLEPLIEAPGFTGASPGKPSRWNRDRAADWYPLKTQFVVEIQYDHFTDGRFRHGTSILRWRPDKAPQQCTYDQLSREVKGTAKLLKEE